MTSVWAYPWTFRDGTVTAELEERGIDEVSVAAHYHSIRTVNPRTPKTLFETQPGGCYFRPRTADFDDTPIAPRINDVDGMSDPLDDVLERTADREIDVTAWVVCFHNTKLGEAYPQFRIEDPFGHCHPHSLCPSYDAVRSYFTGVVRSLATYDIDRIGLESIGYPSVFHGHGPSFGHEKNFAITGDSARALFSQCFCDGCVREASEFGIELRELQSVVQRLCERALESSADNLPPLRSLLDDHDGLKRLFEFRSDVIAAFVRELSLASGDVALNYYASDGASRDPGDGRCAGIDLDQLSRHLNRITALCYTRDPSEAYERIRAYQSRVSLPVDAGVTVDTSVVGDRNKWSAVVERVLDADPETVNVYNYSLMTDDHVDWLADVSR